MRVEIKPLNAFNFCQNSDSAPKTAPSKKQTDCGGCHGNQLHASILRLLRLKMLLGLVGCLQADYKFTQKKNKINKNEIECWRREKCLTQSVLFSKGLSLESI